MFKIDSFSYLEASSSSGVEVIDLSDPDAFTED